MRTAYKCRAYPSTEQSTVLNRTFGCVCLVWNKTLAWRHQRWHGDRQSTNVPQANANLTAMEQDPGFAFLSEVSSVPLQQVLRHQQKAFANFFAKRTKYPRFKTRESRQSAEYTRSGFKYRDGKLFLAKMSAARYQRRMARKARGSQNRRKAKRKVAVAHRKIRHARNDFLHKTTTRTVREYDVVVIEDLSVKGMVRNRSLARAISDSGWGTFRSMLACKAHKWGTHLVVIDRFFPSSKTCSNFQYLLSELKLSTRYWTCPGCGTRHDRDINAAKNILAAGLAVAACGGDVRHSESPRMQSPTKQETRPVRGGIPRS